MVKIMFDFYKHFIELRSTLVDISDRDMIDYFGEGLKDRYAYADFTKHRPETSAEFCEMVNKWIDVDERTREKFNDQNR